MTAPSPNEVTQLLQAWGDGDHTALEKLTPLVYVELHRLAERYMCRERPGHLLQTTALVNEAYVRLVDLKQVRWQNRAHFFGIAAQLMRHILVDFARARRRAEHRGFAQQVSLDEAALVAMGRSSEFIALDDALRSLVVIDPRKSRIVELRYFGGLNVEETAEVLQISQRTVMREWNLARAWLHRELNGGSPQ